MLPLLLIGIAFFFLVCGSVLFLALFPLRNTRRYALSAALWCAIWGPCIAAIILVGTLGLLGVFAIPQSEQKLALYAPHLLSRLGIVYAIICTVSTACIASLIAKVHQLIINRLPFGLFRVYSTLVVAGIGSVFGWCLGFWSSTLNLHRGVHFVVWLLSIVVLLAGFGIIGFRFARTLRSVGQDDNAAFSGFLRAMFVEQ